MENISVVFEPERNRSAAYDNGQLIGVCQYEQDGDAWVITHTEVIPAYGGRGIARVLVNTVLEQAQSQGVEVIPACSYARKVMESE